MKAILTAAVLLLAGPVWANFAEMVKLGDAYDAQYKPEAALQYYLPAEKLNPNDAALLVKIARQYIYLMIGLPDKAARLKSGRTGLAYAERAVQIAPNESDPHLAVAICLGKITQLVSNREGVEASFKIKTAAEMAIKLNPKSDYAWHVLGRWHQSLAEIGGLTRAVAYIVYGGLPSASYDESVRCFQKAIALNPKRLIHYVELGRTYAFMGRKDEAKKLIQQGLAMPSSEMDDAETKERGQKTLKEI